MPDPRLPRSAAPVLIAGGGPAGLATAAELAHHGIRSVLVEPRAEISHTRPRAKTTSPRTMEIFRRWGIAAAIREAAPLKPEWCRRIIFCTTLNGETLTTFDDAFGMRSAPDELFAESGQQIPQPLVEEVLRAHVAATGLVDLRWGERITGLIESTDNVTCELTRPDGSTYRITVDYVAGCDGSRSVCAGAIGSNLEGATSTRSNLNLVFRAPGFRAGVGEAVQYWALGPEVMGTVGPLDGDDLWWAGLGGIDASCTHERAVTLLRELFGVGRDNVDIELLATDPWVPRMLIADRWSSDRVFLVGESAHVNPPFGGHGFNTCVGDAVNIGWKLAAVLQGWADPRLLRTYEQERRDVAQQTIDAARRNLEASGPGIAMTHERLQETKFEEFNSLGLVLGYSYAGSPAVTGRSDTPFDAVTFVPRIEPGSRLPHAWVAPGRALYDELGPDLTVIHTGPHGSDALESLTAQAREMGAPLRVVSRLTDSAMPALTLVRPDQHIAWVGDEFDAEALPRALSRLAE